MSELTSKSSSSNSRHICFLLKQVQCVACFVEIVLFTAVELLVFLNLKPLRTAMKPINGYDLGHTADHVRGHHHLGAYGTRLDPSVEYYNFYRSDTAPYFRWNKWSHVRRIIGPGLLLPAFTFWTTYKFHMVFQIKLLCNYHFSSKLKVCVMDVQDLQTPKYWSISMKNIELPFRFV